MILRTCDSKCGCGTFQGALNLLKSWGVEPSIDEDETSPFFEFSIPSEWVLERRKVFHRRINVLLQMKHMIQPHCQFCDSYISQQYAILVCYKCEMPFAACGECMENMPPSCPNCGQK